AQRVCATVDRLQDALPDERPDRCGEHARLSAVLVGRHDDRVLGRAHHRTELETLLPRARRRRSDSEPALPATHEERTSRTGAFRVNLDLTMDGSRKDSMDKGFIAKLMKVVMRQGGGVED